MQRHRATFDCRLRRRLCTTNQNNCTSTHTGKQVHTDVDTHTHTETQTGMQTHRHTLGPASLSLRHTPLEERETTQSVKSEGRCALFGLRTRRETKPTTTTTAAQQAKMKSSSGKKEKNNNNQMAAKHQPKQPSQFKRQFPPPPYSPAVYLVPVCTPILPPSP